MDLGFFRENIRNSREGDAVGQGINSFEFLKENSEGEEGKRLLQVGRDGMVFLDS